jgi:hypothetical protein
MSNILTHGLLWQLHRFVGRARAAVGVLALTFLTSLPTGMERGVANSTVTRHVLQVEHIKMETTKKFADVAAALEGSVPKLDPAIAEALAEGANSGRRNWKEVRRSLSS